MKKITRLEVEVAKKFTCRSNGIRWRESGNVERVSFKSQSLELHEEECQKTMKFEEQKWQREKKLKESASSMKECRRGLKDETHLLSVKPSGCQKESLLIFLSLLMASRQIHWY